MQKLHAIKALQTSVLVFLVIWWHLCKSCLLKFFWRALGRAHVFEIKIDRSLNFYFVFCFHVILGVVKIRKVAKYWIPSANARNGARQKKLRKAMSRQKWFENEIKKSREFQSNLSTFSACNFQLEIFDYHYPNNHNSKNSFFVLLRKFELLPRVFVFFL